MTDKSEGPTNPYGHEDCDDISGCGDKCKISAWDNGYAAGFKAGLDEEIATRETKLLARIAELERVLKSVAAYVEEGECYCFNAEEDLGRNPCDFCVASREIKTVMGRE